MNDLRSIIETVRSLGFGGLIGGGLGALIYFYTDRYSPFLSLGPYIFIGISAALGMAGQHAIERVLTFVFYPVFGYVRFRLKLLEIDNLVRSGRISPEEAQRLILKLCEKRLLE